ncbi:hypothetical protein C2S52_000697 [Perilla frutescens var. hirtella]|nr:hypothetical protein C2S52_000697 [Perilla frutescens var. hirtella]
MKFQGQLVYHLLLYMEDRANSNGFLRFKINDRVFVFGPKEYFLITGLKFGAAEALPTESMIYKNIFDSKVLMKLQDIEKAFEIACLASNGGGQLVLKLAHLLVLYALLLCRDTHGKTIDVQYVHLVNDLSKFEKYPWGSISYKFMVDSILDARARLKNMLKKKMKPNFDIYGFTFVFQLLAFEISRELGAYCGEQVPSFEEAVPCMLRWSTPNFFRFYDLKKFFTPEHSLNWVWILITYSAGDERKLAKKRYGLRSAGEAFSKSPSSLDVSSLEIGNSEFHHKFTGDRCKESSFTMRKTGDTDSIATLLKVVSPRMKTNVDAYCTPKSAKMTGDMDMDKNDACIDGEGGEPTVGINIRDEPKEFIALDESESCGLP